MKEEPTAGVDQASFLDLVGALRPELHRYCARLTGSVIDGEDVVQDAIAKAYHTLETLKEKTALRAWLFRIAHNRALDLVRSRALRAADPLESASEVADEDALDPLERLMRQEAIATAVSRFIELPTIQRAALILKDVLGHSLHDIAALLDISADAVKGHLARGRRRLQAINARPRARPADRVPSAENQLYAELFNRHDWEGLRALLADDVKLNQATYAVKTGASVGMFFTTYGRNTAIHVAPAWLEGREVLAVFEHGPAAESHHFMQIEWRNGRIASIRDYRYVPYIMENAELVLAQSTSSVDRLH